MYFRGVGTATPAARYTKAECLDAFERSEWYGRLDARAHFVARTVLQRDNGIEARRLAVGSLAEVFTIDPNTLSPDGSVSVHGIFPSRDGRLVADGTEESISQGAATAGLTLVLEVSGEGGATAAGERARAAIGKVPGVVSAKVARIEGEVAHLTVDISDDRRAQVARAVVESGLGLLRLDKQSVELESIFQRLVHARPRN